MGLAAGAAAAILAATLAGCAYLGPAYRSPPDGVAAVVDMPNVFSYLPETRTVPAGSTVLWRNRSSVRHTITDNPQRLPRYADMSLPPGAATIDSGDVMPGEVYAYTFTIPGTYDYICLPHQSIGMTARVVVVAEPPPGR